ncbi:hypothetical protein [Actinocorallia aurantiaca]|uniref:Uncharacterized protein n=1 Tax=Actinocorallia aurantiaca TaxID=46204 RepID=A0ABP6H3G3_9ACTN
MIDPNASDADVAIAAARAGAEAVHAGYGQRLPRIDKGVGDFATDPESTGAPAGQAGRGLVAAADAETHELLLSMIRGRG